MNNDRGYSLIELLVTVAVIAAMATIAMLGNDFLAKHRVKSASREFYANLQALRQQALTTSTDVQSLGHGLIFNSDNSYTTFEFIDQDGDYNFNKDDTSEQAERKDHSIPEDMNVLIYSKADDKLFPVTAKEVEDFNPLIYDRRGLSRKANWSSVSARTYIFQHHLVDPPACVVISAVRIREGRWLSNDCNIN